MVLMNIGRYRLSVLVFACLVASVTLTACEDKRVRAVDAGISRDSAIKVISGGEKAPGAAADDYPNVYRRSWFIVKGKQMEVLWFTATGKKPGRDTLPYRELTPIVLYDNKVIGKGWSFWEETAKANNIPLPPVDTTKK
jgi:hypothetical protein